MKYLFLLFPIFSFSQIINIPDPVLKNYLIGPGVGYHLDTNGDGEVSQQEALSLINFTTFNYFVGGVSTVANFTGLEHFTNLQSIEILVNEATSLNLNNLTNLKDLRISGANSGGTLNPISFSPIVNLTVNGCTSLESITLGLSSIQNLDLTTNFALKKFYASESKLETVNFNGLPLLERVEILNGGFDQNFTFNGMLNNAQFGGNTALNFVEIRNQPNLLALDFTGASSLANLYCNRTGLTTLNIQNLSNLAYADCSNNQITQLDLSGLSNLVTLHCEYNQIDKLDFTTVTKIVQATCNNNLIEELIITPASNQLYYIDCSFNKITTLNFENLGNEFKQLGCQNNLLEEIKVQGTDLRGINCSNNNLTALNLEWVQNLTGLDCSNNQISSINMKHVIANPYDLLINNQGAMKFDNNPLLYACVDDFQVNNYDAFFSATNMSSVGVSATCEFAPTIFPNPVGSMLNISSGSKIDSFNIYDMNGRLVLSNLVNANSYSNSISELQTGIYVLEIISNNTSKFDKIVKN